MGFNSFPCNPYPISTEELNKGNNDALNTRVTALEGDVSDLEEQKANQITIALPFNAETAYEVGDLVYYNGLSYRCTNAHQGEWDADDFAGTTIANELSSLRSGLTNVGACDNLLAIANADTTMHAFANNIAGYRLLLIYTSYYANSPNPIYNSVILPVPLLASMAEYMEFDGIKIAFSYGDNGVQVTDWGTNSRQYVNFVGIK